MGSKSPPKKSSHRKKNFLTLTDSNKYISRHSDMSKEYEKCSMNANLTENIIEQAKATFKIDEDK